MSSPDRDRRGRRGLVLVAALFLVPLASAFWLYYGGTGWRPTGATQRGDLIEPARPLPPVALLDADGRACRPGCCGMAGRCSISAMAVATSVAGGRST
jgi:hypothetical protein